MSTDSCCLAKEKGWFWWLLLTTLPHYVLFGRKLLKFRIFLACRNDILSCFLYFNQGRRSCPGASCNFIDKMLPDVCKTLAEDLCRWFHFCHCWTAGHTGWYALFPVVPIWFGEFWFDEAADGWRSWLKRHGGRPGHIGAERGSKDLVVV